MKTERTMELRETQPGDTMTTSVIVEAINNNTLGVFIEETKENIRCRYFLKHINSSDELDTEEILKNSDKILKEIKERNWLEQSGHVRNIKTKQLTITKKELWLIGFACFSTILWLLLGSNVIGRFWSCTEKHDGVNNVVHCFFCE